MKKKASLGVMLSLAAISHASASDANVDYVSDPVKIAKFINWTPTAKEQRAWEEVDNSSQHMFVNDPAQVARILDAIPAVKGSMNDRIAVAKLHVESLYLTKLSKEDISDEADAEGYHLNIGDTSIQIYAKGPHGIDSMHSRELGCDLYPSNIGVFKHGSTYYPEFPTGKCLMTGNSK